MSNPGKCRGTPVLVDVGPKKYSCKYAFIVRFSDKQPLAINAHTKARLSSKRAIVCITFFLFPATNLPGNHTRYLSTYPYETGRVLGSRCSPKSDIHAYSLPIPVLKSYLGLSQRFQLDAGTSSDCETLLARRPAGGRWGLSVASCTQYVSQDSII